MSNQQQAINFSYSQGTEYAKFIFNNLNGRINSIFPAKYLIFDLNNESDILGKAIGDIVIIYMHNILKFINFTLKNQYIITEKKIRCLIAYIVIHELFHLNQDFNKYISQYSKDRVTEAIENSCNIVSIDFLQNLIANDYYKTYYGLENNLFEYVFDIYNKVQNNQFGNCNSKYYELKCAEDRISYILNNIIFNNDDNLILWIKKKKWKYLYLEYKYDGIIQNGDLIYINNHYINHNIILKMLDKFLLLMAFSSQTLKVSEMTYDKDPSIAKIVIDIINYKPMPIISSLNLDIDTPILF